MLPEPHASKLGLLISRLEATTDDQWCMDIVRSKDQTKNCILGHVFAMGKNDEEGNAWWNWFEHYIAITLMVYPVNDGKDKRYPQETPRARCLAYLQDVLSGKLKSLYEELTEETEECS